MGSPEDLYLRPRSRFLADFIGLSNIYSAHGKGGHLAVTEGEGWTLQSEQSVPEGACAVALRPEGLRLLKEGQSSPNEAEGKVVLKMFMGTTVKYLVVARGLTLHAAVPQAEADPAIENGQTVRLGCAARDVLVLGE
jgi:spermidine/putrescine transport system ATP-binding protein/putrescine transport system ATP-binding protein